MEMKEKLKAVKVQIRKEIPRLMELREDCRFEFKDIKFKVVHIDEYYIQAIDELTSVTALEHSKKPEFKIIGSEIMLNDVLEYLFKYKIEPHGILVFWDLSSPYLKDQPEELIEFLYNLLKK